MVTIRPSKERGHLDHGWLDTYHTFSFGTYYDEAHMGFRDLRVINEDRVEESQGFGTHPHRDMEIVTYVVDGALEHKDSMGNGSVIRRGDVQHMSAGRGVMHSEFNPSKFESVHLLQIWILPEEKGITPTYDQNMFDDDAKRGRLRLVVSPDGAEDSVKIRQNTRMYASILPAGDAVEHAIADGRHAWVQVITGAVELNGHRLSAGDGAAVSEESKLALKAIEEAEFLLFDLA
ncbi:MAG: pirin family protein [Bacteroidetes bacterium]|nr:pirin family protein [Bacteroidota bacterium]